MALLSCQKLSHTYLDQPLFADVSFHLEAREKAALQGANGTGKTTLLRIIAGDLAPTSGQVMLAREARIGYLAQIAPVPAHTGIYDALAEAKAEVFAMEASLREMETEMKRTEGEALTALMESYAEMTHAFEQANGFAARSEIEGVFRGLGFAEADRTRDVDSLSGGQKTRLALGRLLLTSPDLLLLDEPTNHLDLDSIRWLESYLASFPGAVLLVSHDRWFLDRIVSKVFDLENGAVTTYPGNYTAYYEKKSARRKAELHAWKKQTAEIRHQEDVIKKLKQFNREKSIRRAESREKALAKIDRLDGPAGADQEMRLDLAPRIESGNDVLAVEHLSKSFDDLHLLADQSFLIRRGERVAVIGKNGCGKTTLLRMIQRELLPDAGEIRRGAGVEIGYFDQAHGALDPDKTIFDEISDAWPDLNNTKIRNVLAAFLFRGDAVFQTIGTLSGGEQGRVMLAKLMLSQANFLLLDEPTNHLDALSKEVLEDALRAYTGTVLYVSHDRWFIDRTATRILELSDGVLTEYLGNYQDYLDKSGAARVQTNAGPMAAQNAQTHAPDADSADRADASGTKLDWQAQKQRDAEARKKARMLQETEDEIAQIEARQIEIEETLALPETGLDGPLCQALADEQAQLSLRLEECYEVWESLMDED